MPTSMTTGVLDWLLEKDNPSVRYFALRDLASGTDRALQTARRAIMGSGPVVRILAAQSPEGYWAKPGNGYSPKYQATTWQMLFLAELGAEGRHSQVRRGSEYVLSHTQAISGGFSASATSAPSWAIHCLTGNMVWALLTLGYRDDERVQRAVEWLAGAITGVDFEWYFKSGTSGPGFRCVANGHKPCAWGAVKALRALANIPVKWQSERVKNATALAAEFLLSHDLSKANYPTSGRVSGEWFKFGFPLSYTSDVLEAVAALCDAGCAHDPRLQRAFDLVRNKREDDGRWKLRHSLNGKMWVDIESKGKASRWVTLRALRVLRASGETA